MGDCGADFLSKNWTELQESVRSIYNYTCYLTITKTQKSALMQQIKPLKRKSKYLCFFRSDFMFSFTGSTSREIDCCAPVVDLCSSK